MSRSWLRDDRLNHIHWRLRKKCPDGPVQLERADLLALLDLLEQLQNDVESLNEKVF